MAAEDFIITRKRKLFKFARFAELPNCFEAADFTPEVRGKFVGKAKLTIEVGAGTGLFALELARRHPKRRFIAVDVKADRLYTGARQAAVEGIKNICFVRAHATRLTDVFAPKSIDTLWLTFADPYPKKRAAKHRMTHPLFLDMYKKIMADQGMFYFKTDNQALFEWSLERLVDAKAQLNLLSFDLHQSDLPDEFKIMTTFEQRYVAQKKPIYMVGSSLFS